MSTSQPVIAIVEDSLMHRLCWKQWLEDRCRLILCAGPRQFWNVMHAEPGLFESLACVITDYYFDAIEDDAEASEPDVDNGVELARQIKQRRAALLVLLASGVEGLDDEGAVDGWIVKAPEPKERAFAVLEQRGVLAKA